MTIEHWLVDRYQAGPDQVELVAQIFGWSGAELLYGKAPDGVMDRVAELESFRERTLRFARETLQNATTSAVSEDEEILERERVEARSQESQTDSGRTGKRRHG